MAVPGLGSVMSKVESMNTEMTEHLLAIREGIDRLVALEETKVELMQASVSG